jgi:hypothetical protein
MRSRGGLIKLPPGARAVITNYGSGSGSLLFFIKDLKNFDRKKVKVASIHVRKEVLKLKKVIFKVPGIL